MVPLTRGQELAIRQLRDIEGRSRGAFEVIGAPIASKREGCIWVRFSVETRVYREAGGLPFRDRERFHLHLPSDFPFKIPDLYFSHKRFIGTPHVQWGTYICLYQSIEAEYEPSDGMFGFIERVRAWLRAAGSGQLDPDDAPLHPPVAYPSSSTKFVVAVDTPKRDSLDPIWLGKVDLRKVRGDRFDVTGWTHIADWDAAEPASVSAAAVLLNKPVAMEYPSKVYDLIKQLESAGLDFSGLYGVLRLLSLMRQQTEPGFLVLGAPMRRKSPGEPMRPHLTVWEIAAEPLNALRELVESGNSDEARGHVAQWMAEAEVHWCQVLEGRPEVTERRDGQTALSAIRDRRVLLLGCGALGSAVAESIVRAGARSLHLVDKSLVKPGLLVRQRFNDVDVGLRKAEALMRRLDDIGTGCVIGHDVCDLAEKALERFVLDDFDVIIDATASASVARRMEEEIQGVTCMIPIVSLSISQAAKHGCVMVRQPEYSCGPVGLARQAKLALLTRDARHPAVQAFWPKKDEAELFQPEPGCSEPTFVGSAADMDFHAAALLNMGVQRMTTLGQSQASVDLLSAPWHLVDSRAQAHIHHKFVGYLRTNDQVYGYSVFCSAIAERGMSTEMRRIARVRSDRVETGGLIFGEIDDSHRYIWIDSVSGPPPDSEASPEKFLCGTAGTHQLANQRSEATGGSSNFIGIWHTHPISRGEPSADDLAAMVQLLHLQAHPPRQVLMAIVGFSATTPQPIYHLFRRDQFQLVLVEEPTIEGES